MHGKSPFQYGEKERKGVMRTLPIGNLIKHLLHIDFNYLCFYLVKLNENDRNSIFS